MNISAKTKIIPILLLAPLLLAMPVLSAEKKAVSITIAKSTTVVKTTKKTSKKNTNRASSKKTPSAIKKNPQKQPKPKKSKEETTKEKSRKMADRIIKVLDFGIQDERLESLNKIKEVKDKSIQKELLVKLEEIIRDEQDSQILVRAITVASQLEAHNTKTAIITQLGNESEDVQVAAVYALKKLKVTSTKNVMIKMFKNQDLSKNSSLTETLLNTLGEFKANELSSYAQKAINNHKTASSVRQYLVLFLGNTNDNSSTTFLLKLYNDPDENIMIRAFAINSLAKRKQKSAATDIKKMLKKIDAYSFKKKQKYYRLYIYSIAALARLGDKTALPRLQNSLKSNNVSVRLNAIRLIRELKDQKDKRTIDILKYKMEYDPNAKVRAEATATLKELGVDVETKRTDKKK